LQTQFGEPLCGSPFLFLGRAALRVIAVHRRFDGADSPELLRGMQKPAAV
jgi:hypothetical protein